MSLTIAGKNMDIGNALRQRIEERISISVEKYFDGNHSGQITMSKSGAGFASDCVLHLDTGIILRASATDGDAIRAFEQAADKIDKRLRRYKRRLKAHNHGTNAQAFEAMATEVVIATPDDEEELEANYAPLVVAETPTKIKTLTVGMAVLELDLTDAPVLMFMNAANSTLNVVFRRSDGNVGWIDPSLTTGGASGGQA
ncbi:MAG: ribosome-associated translation inhibitor RaiA [Pseudomonadota bacterium]